MKLNLALPGDCPRRPAPLLAAAGLALWLAGCAAAPDAGGIDDPFEPANRVVHGLNRGLDATLVRPASQVAGSVVPDPLRSGVSNLAATLDMPVVIANDLLQFRVMSAATNVLRLGMNLTLGLGGFFDPATAAGMPEGDNDFGRTLAVWGFGEGPYLELPVLGPSTLRDTVGAAVDIAFDPLRNVFSRGQSNTALAVKAGARLNDRYKFSDTVDSILYDSADSYAQARLLYLQHRRFVLGEDGAGDGFIDPYEDPNGQ